MVKLNCWKDVAPAGTLTKPESMPEELKLVHGDEKVDCVNVCMKEMRLRINSTRRRRSADMVLRRAVMADESTLVRVLHVRWECSTYNVKAIISLTEAFTLGGLNVLVPLYPTST